MAIINGYINRDGLTDMNKIQADCEALSQGSEEIKDSKDMILACFDSFKESEDYLQSNWEGDTANRFKRYRARMDLALSKALNVSEHLGIQTADFARISKQIDEEAAVKAKGLK